MKYRSIDIDEASASFEVHKHLYGARAGAKLLLVEGDIEVDALNLNGRIDGAYGYIIDGDLTVRGTLESSDDRVMALLVTGTLRAGVVYSSGADTAVLGDLVASQGVVGNYNHGYLHVAGRIQTPWLVNANHDLTWGALEATAIDLYHGEFEPPYTRGFEDLVEGIYDEDCEEVDFQLLLELMASGRPFLTT